MTTKDFKSLKSRLNDNFEHFKGHKSFLIVNTKKDTYQVWLAASHVTAVANDLPFVEVQRENAQSLTVEDLDFPNVVSTEQKSAADKERKVLEAKDTKMKLAEAKAKNA